MEDKSVSRLFARRKKIVETFAELKKEFDEITEKLKNEIAIDINGNKTE